MSQTTLARILNLDLAAVERLERGDVRSPDRQLVLDLARALGLNESQTDELLWSGNHLPLRARSSEAREPRTVALFVDHENIFIALNDVVRALPTDVQVLERRKIEPRAIAAGLRSRAEQVGWVKLAMAIADWEKFPRHPSEYEKVRFDVKYSSTGRNNADLRLSNAIRDVLEDDRNADIDTYILVTGDGGYMPVLDTLLSRQKQVQVWGVRGATNVILQRNATETAWVEDVLGLPALRTLPTRPEVDDGRPSFVAPVLEPDDMSPLGPGAVPLGNEVSRLEALAIHLSRYLRMRSWSFITFVRFLSFLSEVEVFGQTREEQLAWLSHAKDTGVLREEVVDDPNDPTRIARRFYLNETHPLVVRALQIRARVGEIVPVGGRGMAFGMVIDRLIADPELQLSDVQAKSWLTWFAEAGYLQAETVPHFRKEGVTVTLLRQAPGYWESVAVPDEAPATERLRAAADFAAVRLANFLERHPHFGWMALSQLLNQMTEAVPQRSVGGLIVTRQAAKQVVAYAQDGGLLAIEQIPNVKTGGATTVARLIRENPRVQELLATRDALVRRLAEMPTSRLGVHRALFQSSVAERFGLSYDEAGDWIDLLAGEGLIVVELDHDGATTLLRADLQDLIVSRVLYGSLQAGGEVRPEPPRLMRRALGEPT